MLDCNDEGTQTHLYTQQPRNISNVKTANKQQTTIKVFLKEYHKSLSSVVLSCVVLVCVFVMFCPAVII